MDGLTVQVRGADELAALYRKTPEIVQQELSLFMHGATQHMRSEVVDRTPAAMGTLRASVSASVETMADGMLGIVGTPQPYAVPVELGTKPHFPPVQALEDWVRQKLGVSGTDVRRVAYLVARKISKKGTKGHFMFRDAFEANAAEVQRQFDQTVSRIVARI